MYLELILPLPTSLNKLYINQYSYNPKKKMRVPTGKRILSKDGQKKKSEIRSEAKVQIESQDTWNFDFTKDGYIYQDIIIYFPRRGSDPDNILKLLNDSLEGIVFDNDSRVLSRIQKVMYDTSNPRVSITYKPVSYIGIFDSKENVDDFESVCKTCSRYRKGSCSILKDSLNGTIRDEVDEDLICSEYKEKK